jgi:hypothetical protein
MALTAYTVANNLQPIAAQIDHAVVTGILKDKDLGDFLNDVGIWK